MPLKTELSPVVVRTASTKQAVRTTPVLSSAVRTATTVKEKIERIQEAQVIQEPKQVTLLKPEPVRIRVKEPEPVIEVLREQIKEQTKPPETVTQNQEEVTKFGKTIVGKILKGAAITAGAVVGIGTVGRIVSGAGVGSAAAAAVRPLDKIATGAVNLVTGTTKVERQQVKEVKAEAKAAADKLEQVDRLVKAGATPAQARAMVGIDEAELQTFAGEKITGSAIEPKTLLLIAGAAAALFILPKLFKR